MRKPLLACLVLMLAQVLSGCSRFLQVMLFKLDPWRLHLSAAGREYVYDLPHSLDHIPRAEGTPVPLKAQLESNFQIYLLQAAATAVDDVSRFGRLQHAGFPLHRPRHLQE